MNAATDAADEPDEATRILQAATRPPDGDVQAMLAAAGPSEEEEDSTTAIAADFVDEDERTTILHRPQLSPVTPIAAATEMALTTDNGEAAAMPLEPETDDLAGAPAPFSTWSDDDAGSIEETITTDRAGPEDIAGPSAAARLRDETEQADNEDEATTILRGPTVEEDEPTTVLPQARSGGRQSPETAPAGELLAFSMNTAPETVSSTVAMPPAKGDGTSRGSALMPGSPDGQDATPILPDTGQKPGTLDSTEILQAAELAGLQGEATGQDGQVSGRTWFDRRLRDFNHALLHTQTGRKRPVAERQALAAAARDMISRVGLADPEHKPADWADSVLQADQLLVNTYFVRALIARGGVGEIYRARHRDLKTEHAIKILLPRYALDPTVLNLMLEEARLLQRVRHEAVVGCQGLLRDVDGRPMLVMDYLRGPTLSARLRRGKLPPPDLIILAIRLASGLAAVHAEGLVHQDISPDNIILVDDNCAAATIIDFGLARSVDSPENTHRNIDFAGKFSWCSPEQLSSRASHVDTRSDLYSLGLVLAAAARGARLDMGSDLVSARAARHAVPSLDGIDEPIASLLRHLLAPSPTTRLHKADDVPDRLRPKRSGIVQRLFGR